MTGPAGVDYDGHAFPREEHEGRLARVRQAMADQGLDALVCIAPESLYYIAGYDAHTHFSEQALVVSRSEEQAPVLVIRDVDAALAAETSWLEDVRTYHHGTDDVVDIVRDTVPAAGVVGVEMATYAAPGAYTARFRQLGGTVVDAGELVGLLRVIKSRAELDYMREAARLNNLGVDAAFAAARPGITELELGAEIEYATRRAGSEYPGMPVWLSSGPRTLMGHGTPTTRLLRENEPVTFCFGTAKRRYNVTSYRTIHLGEPSATFRAAYEIGEIALQELVDHTEAGRPVRDACRAAAAVFSAKGVPVGDVMRWGYGVGIGYPPSHLEPLDITEESDAVFAPGMVFCLHAGLYPPEDGFGILVGGDYLLGEDGVEALDRAGPALRVV